MGLHGLRFLPNGFPLEHDRFFDLFIDLGAKFRCDLGHEELILDISRLHTRRHDIRPNIDLHSNALQESLDEPIIND